MAEAESLSIKNISISAEESSLYNINHKLPTQTSAVSKFSELWHWRPKTTTEYMYM